MKNVFLIIGLVFTIGETLPQSSTKSDSIEYLLQNATDREKIRIYLDLSEKAKNTDKAQFDEYIAEALALAFENSYSEDEVDIYILLGQTDVSNGELKSSRSNFEHALELAEEIDYSAGLAKIYKGLGDVLYYEKDYSKAILQYQKGVDIISQLPDKSQLPVIYLEIGYTYLILSEKEKALSYYYKSLEAGQLEQNMTAMSKSYQAIGNFYRFTEPDKYEENLKKAVSLTEGVDNKATARFYRSLGRFYKESGNYQKGLDYLLRALKISESDGDLRDAAIAANSVGVIFYEQRNYARALEYYRRYLNISRSLNYTTGEVAAYVNIGLSYHETNESDSAESNFIRSIEIADQANLSSSLDWAYNGLATIRTNQERYSDARKWVEKALEIRRNNKRARVHLAQSLNTYARINFLEGQYDSALVHYRNAEIMAKAGSRITYLRDALKGQSQVYEKLENSGKALEYFKLFTFLNDSIINLENTRDITRLEAEYEFEKEKDSIAFEQQRAELTFQRELDKKQSALLAAIGGGSLVLIILGLLYRSYRIKKQNNQELKKKNEIIGLKNEELTTRNTEITELRETEKQLAEETLAMKERELTTITMLSHEKNTVLQNLNEHIGSLTRKVDDRVIPDLEEIKKIIKSNLSEETWSSFMMQFEKVHPKFFRDLKTRFPSLTQHDLRLCSYLKVGMDNKEIAQISAISLDSVKKNVYRLKKKMELDPEQDLREFFMKT